MKRSKPGDEQPDNDETWPDATEIPRVEEDRGGPVAGVPALDPEAFESYEGFRETTLAIFTDPADNGALRRFGAVLSEMAWDYARHWPPVPGGSFRHQVRAGVSDLRHLQGFLARLGREHQASVLTAEETGLGRVCGRLAVSVKGIADTLERELAASERTTDEP